MQELNDSDLLHEYVERGSETAFATLVERHVNQVYSVALRQTGNPHSAEEITQAVFVILAGKARQLVGHPVLSGWLYQTSRLTALTFLKGEIRRTHREQEAHMQNVQDETEADNWHQVAPLLDTAMAALSEIDRHAVVLRFFDGKSMSEVGMALGATEEAAKKRVGRAIEKLQTFFTRRGVTSTADTLTRMISAHSVQVAPAALAKTVVAIALAKGATASTSTLTLTKGALKLMAWTKAKTAIVIGAVALLTTSTAVIGIRTAEHRHADQVEGYFDKLDSAYLETAPPMVLLRPSKYAKGDYIITGRETGPDAKLMRRGADFAEILTTAYGVGQQEMVLPADAPGGRFDLLLTTTNHQQEALRAEIKRQFGLSAHMETRTNDVLFLRIARTDSPGFRISTNEGAYIWAEPSSLKLRGFKMSDPGSLDIPHVLARYYRQAVVDETDLTNAYDVDVHWNTNVPDSARKKEFEKALREQVGFELVPGHYEQDMLIVQKTN